MVGCSRREDMAGVREASVGCGGGCVRFTAGRRVSKRLASVWTDLDIVEFEKTSTRSVNNQCARSFRGCVIRPWCW